MKLLPQEHAKLVEQAIIAAQSAGELPAFELPTIEIRPPKKAEQGDYACAVAMQLAKPTGKSPFDIATIITNRIPKADFVASVEVLKPGFINFAWSY